MHALEVFLLKNAQDIEWGEEELEVDFKDGVREKKKSRKLEKGDEPKKLHLMRGCVLFLGKTICKK